MSDLPKIDITSLSHNQLKQLVESQNTRRELLVEIYEKLKGNKADSYIMGKIALHMHTPSEILSKMCNDHIIVSLTESGEHYQVSDTPIADATTYITMMFGEQHSSALATPKYVSIGHLLIQNPNTPPETLNKIWLENRALICYGATENFDFNTNLAKHPNVSSEILSQLYGFSEYIGVVKEVVDVLVSCSNLRKNLNCGPDDGREIVKYIAAIQDINLRKMACAQLIEINKQIGITNAESVILQIETKILEAKTRASMERRTRESVGSFGYYLLQIRHMAREQKLQNFKQ